MNGIHLQDSNGNSVVYNTANGNANGIFLLSSNNNVVIANTLLNNVICYNETGSINNLFSDNICTAPSVTPPGLDPFVIGLLIGLAIGLGALAAVVIFNLVRGKRK